MVGEEVVLPGWDLPTIGVGRHVHTHQKLVAYRGLDGEDRGEIFFCPLSDWAAKFSPAAKAS